MIERRAFLTGLIAACAAPAIVKASSLMPLRGTRQLIVPARAVVLSGITEYFVMHDEVVDRLDVLYGYTQLRSEWTELKLDDYSKRILQPMITNLSNEVAWSIVNKQNHFDTSDRFLFGTGLNV